MTGVPDEGRTDKGEIDAGACCASARSGRTTLRGYAGTRVALRLVTAQTSIANGYARTLRVRLSTYALTTPTPLRRLRRDTTEAPAQVRLRGRQLGSWCRGVSN